MTTTDPRLQDYLDDRMSVEERKGFEGQLAREPQLAARLAELRALQREVQGALRAQRDDEPLPPGFYTRARAAFELRHGRRKPRLFDMLSWEALGLAAAAGLALALFVPGLLRDDLPLERSPGAEAQPTSVAEGPDESLADPVAPTVGDQRSNQGLAPVSEGKESVEDRTEVTGLLQVEEDESLALAEDRKKLQPKKKRSVTAAAGREPAAVAPGDTSRIDESVIQRDYAPSPPTSSPAAGSPAARTADAPSPAPVERKDDTSMRRAQADFDRIEAEKSSEEAGAVLTGERSPSQGAMADAQATAVRAVPIPAGAVDRHSVTSVVDPAVLDRLAGGWARARRFTSQSSGMADKNKASLQLGKDADSDLEEPSSLLGPGERAVLIGVRDREFVCEGLRVATSPTEHVIHLAPAPQGRFAVTGGCAVFLPADDRRIVVVDPE